MSASKTIAPAELPKGKRTTSITVVTNSNEQEPRKVLVYPRRYRTAMCLAFTSTGQCEYGDHCSFAHRQEDLRAAAPEDSPSKLADASARARPASFHAKPVSYAVEARPTPGGQQQRISVPKLEHHVSAENVRCDPKLYHTELCRTFASIGFCPYADKCQFAHGIEQLRPKADLVTSTTITSVRRLVSPNLAPSPTYQAASQSHSPHRIDSDASGRRSTFIRDRRTYKTEMCRQFNQVGFCDYEHQCQFAHGIHELRHANDAIVLAPAVALSPVASITSRASSHNVVGHERKVPSEMRVPAADESPSLPRDQLSSEKRLSCDPRLYKTDMCRTYSQFGSCPYEHKCRFAHGLGELRPRPRFMSKDASAGDVPSKGSVAETSDRFAPQRRTTYDSSNVIGRNNSAATIVSSSLNKDAYSFDQQQPKLSQGSIKHNHDGAGQQQKAPTSLMQVPLKPTIGQRAVSLTHQYPISTKQFHVLPSEK